MKLYFIIRGQDDQNDDRLSICTGKTGILLLTTVNPSSMYSRQPKVGLVPVLTK